MSSCFPYRVASSLPVVVLSLVLMELQGAPAVAAEEDGKDITALEEQAFKQAAALVSPSVVQIQTTGGRDHVGRILTGTGPTTGVIVSEGGYIISSAFNFISKPSTILVNLPDGRKNILAKMIATDRSRMLTLLKIDADNLTPAPVAPKESLKVGQWALAMGRTYSLEVPSISVGIISALDRIWGKAIQTDAKVSPVNYGGPLVSVQGKVQGILVPLSTRGSGETAGVEWYDSGIGFAVPMEDVLQAVERLKKGKDLHRGLMGITFKGRGVLGGEPVIARVRGNSPAEQAGLKAGDRIVEVDGKTITRQTGVKYALGPKYAGEVVAVTVKRDGKTITKKVTLVEKLEPFEPPYLGILPVREYAGKGNRPGVGIRHIFPGSPAEEAELQKLDRILKVNDTDVATSAALAETIRQYRPNEKVTLQTLRGKQQRTVTVELATIPNDVVDELTPAVLLPGEKANVKTGRFVVNMPEHEREYWAYVPENYNPKYAYGLMVWLHPTNDTMEAKIFKQWKRICEERGILIVGPKAGKLAGWSPNEATFVKDAVDQFTDRYSVDSSRIFLHTAGDGATFAFQVAFKYRETFRGLAAVGGALRTRPSGNSPEFPMQFHVVGGKKDRAAFQFAQRTVTILRQLKYPTSFTPVDDLGEEYPPAEQVEEIGRWADSLDRI